MLKPCYELCTENTVQGVELSSKYTTRRLYLTQEPNSSTVLFHTSRVNSALTDLLYCVGRISSISSDGNGT